MIRFSSFAADLRQRIHNAAQMSWSSTGGKVLLNVAAVREEPNAVATLCSDLRKGKRRVHGIIQLRGAELIDLNLRAEQPSGVEHNPHSLASLDLKDSGGKLMPPRGRGPAHVTQFVAGPVLAQTLKLPPLSALPPPPLFHLNLAATNQVESLLPSLFHVGQNTNGLRNFHRCPTLRESETTLITQKQLSEPGITSFARHNSILCPRLLPRRNDQQQRGWRAS